MRDASGAAVPGATVTLTNIQQGFTRTAASNSSGDYLFAALPAGNYNIAVTAKGFNKYQIRDLVLRVSEKLRADATLKVGQLSTEITAAGTNLSQVQTQSGSLSGVLTNGNEANTESLEGSAPLVQNSTVYNVPNYTSISVTGIAPPGPLNVTSIPTRAIWPYVQQWNFDVEQEIPSHTVLSVAYAGSKGTHLTDQRGYNQLYALPLSQNPYLPGQAISGNDTAPSKVSARSPGWNWKPIPAITVCRFRLTVISVL